MGYHNSLAGVPQGSVLVLVFYLLYTSNIPALGQNFVATFADDTAILANTNSSLLIRSNIGQQKLNEANSVHVDFTNKVIEYKLVYIKPKTIPYENKAKYLGLTLDAKLGGNHMSRKN